MKRIILIVLSMLQLAGYVSGQNLVPNWDFEEVLNCNYIVLPFDTSCANGLVVPGWCNPAIAGTPDYFHSCYVPHPNFNYSVPLNNLGYQHPRSGDAYAGIVISGSGNKMIESREYIQAMLLAPLLEGRSYCVGFYTAFAFRDIPIANIVSIQDWGAYLSVDRPFNPCQDTPNKPDDCFLLAGDPQIRPDTFITDTMNWTLVHGVYVAEGGEQWITLGNFVPLWTSILDTFAIGSWPDAYISYYFIDDVFVIPMDDGALLPSDTLLCTEDLPLYVEAASGFSNYRWSHGPTSPSIVIDAPGVYVLQADYEGGCVITDTFRVILQQVDQGEMVTVQECESALPFSYVAPAIPDAISYAWSDGTEGQSLEVAQGGLFTLDIGLRCGIRTDSLYVEIYPEPVLDLGPPLDLCQEGILVPVTLFNTTSLPNYLWSTGETTSTIIVETPGRYRLSTDSPCGFFYAEIEVAGCEARIYIPNVFAPNSGISPNNQFKAFAVHATIVSLDIYQRWGGHVLSLRSGDISWDGTWKGQDCPPDLYVYRIGYTKPLDDTIYYIDGEVMLVR
jgi:gliding motility-associated-like protein